MNVIQKTFLLSLIFLFISFQLAGNAISQEIESNLQKAMHAPETRTSQEVQIPEAESQKEQSWLSKNKWWIVLGVIVAAGVGVALGGGGSSDDAPPPSDTGGIDVSW